jgi:hypothetical protein
VSTHSSTSMKPHSGGISARLKTWPLYSTGASQSPHPVTQDRYPGFPACRQRFMIITFGASIWRGGRSSFPVSQMRLETAPAVATNSPSGHRPAAIRPPPFFVKSSSGVPPSVSTPKTADQPEQNGYKWRPPFGNRSSTGRLPCAAVPLAQMYGDARSLGPLKIASGKIDIACLQHALFVGVSRPGPAGKRRR